MYFESHAHYDDRRFKQDGDALLKSFPSLGIPYVVNVGCDLRSSKASIRMAEKYDHVYASVGIHPHELYDMSSSVIDELKKLSAHKKVVAIGEMGLDYHYDTHPREVQRFWFRQQLRLAEEVKLPVIIHSREASEETFEIMQSSNVRRGVIHCYSGAAPMALDYAKMGFYIGIGGVVTYSNARKMVEVVEALPLDRIVIETDCPYLSPTPNRGKRNDSRNLQYVVEKIAEIKNVTPDVVEKVTMENGKSLYF
ncbi:TatD family hydrolase [Chakrabartyella piscis]|uniref:TatD family hydrolase n=1 Tax=Chakrabartyella piscis TaxID=2918914 RepID=UPI002958952E|nr:TatD family hydrolase [Chakrabartyella piscis]